jgi:hypothetical protein
MSEDNKDARPADDASDAGVFLWAKARGITMFLANDGSYVCNVKLDGDGALTHCLLRICCDRSATLRCIFLLPVCVPRDKRDTLAAFFNKVSRKVIGGYFAVDADGFATYEIDAAQRLLEFREALFIHLDWSYCVARKVLGIYHDGIAAIVLGFESAASAASMCEASQFAEEV